MVALRSVLRPLRTRSHRNSRMPVTIRAAAHEAPYCLLRPSHQSLRMGSTANSGSVPTMISRISRRAGGTGDGVERCARSPDAPEKLHHHLPDIRPVGGEHRRPACPDAAARRKTPARSPASCMPSRFWAMARWPELEMGRNSATPCTSPSRNAVKYVIAVPHVKFEYKLLYIVEIIPHVVDAVVITRILYHINGENATGI